ncbi:MAG: hypothetical protein HYV09_29265 [Deltaproteobacteria bacterium]|nr:hypothetical protein [Deltaproteobacteria bacterium]
MSSDIKLGDDESITLVCTKLVSLNSAEPSKPVTLQGAMRVGGTLYVTPWTLHEVEKRDRSGSETAISGRYAELGAAARRFRDLDTTLGDPAKVSDFVSGVISSKYEYDIIDVLREQNGEVDLAREIGLLRAAIISLADRLKGK